MTDDLLSRLRAHADADPARVALSFAAAGPDRVDLSYGELVERTQAMARTLASRLERGERALLLLPSVPEFAVSFLGCLAAGVIAVPVPIPVDESARRRVLNVARDCSVSVIVSLSVIHDFAAAGPPEIRGLCESYDWLLVDRLDEAGPSRRLPTNSAADIAFLQYTSGSTSTPRGVMVSHGALMSNEAAIKESFGVTRESTIVSWLPLHHDMGLIGAMLQPLYAGGRGVILDPLSFVRRPASWLEVISAERADISGGPNFAYDMCTRKVTAAEKSGLDLSSWRVAFNGAAQVYPRTMRAFSEAFRDTGFRPSAHLPCYGLAEATLLVTSTGPATPSTSRSFSVASLESGLATEAKADARELVTYPLPTHTTVRVVDPVTLTPVGDGRSGEILVAGDSNGSGYWGDPAGGAATFGVLVEGAGPFLRTGDLGFRHDGGLYIEGRAKDLVVHRGRNLYPEDLEADISLCDKDIRSGCGAVLGVEHDGDEAVVVCQEVRDGTSPDRYPDIVAHVRETLSSVHAVTARTVVLLAPRTITKTSSGKVQRHAAKRRFLAGELPALFSNTVEPATDGMSTVASRLGGTYARADGAAKVEMLTLALCEHLHEVLGLTARPSGDESLAALGADSVLAVQLQYEVEEALGVTLRPSATLRAASVRDLAHAAVESCSSAPMVSHPDDVAYELTAAQQALWFLQRATPDSFDYNVTRAFRLTGHVDVDAVSAALGAVVRRHPSLRLAVVGTDGVPRGVVHDERAAKVDLVDGRHWTGDEESAWYRTFATTPFDLATEPLLRCALVRRAGDWLLVLSLHHIVCDMSSLAIIVAEITGLPQPSARVSPAKREAAVLAERGAELAEYWRTELGGDLPRLALPQPGRAEPGIGESLAFTADPELTRALTRFARESGLTLHNVLLAAYQVLLHRLTGQPDVVIGVPASGRGDRVLATWVGYLVNVVPIRSTFTPGLGFAGFAERTQRGVLDALDHQDLPLSHITRLVNPDRDTATSTVFQAMFAYYARGQDAMAAVMGDPDAALPWDGCTLHGHPVPDHTTQAEVCLNVAVRQDALVFELQHDKGKVSRAQAAQIAATYQTLLAAIAERPGTTVRSLPLLSADEVSVRVGDSAGPVVARPTHYLDSFELMVDRFPDVIAADDGVVRATYAELDERANHVAAVLRARGVGVDTNVVVSARRSVDYLVALLGIHKADGCYVPVSPVEAPLRAGAMVAAVDAAATIADATGRGLLPDALDLAELTAGRSVLRPARVSPAQGAAYIIHTSGSTGTPKAAVSTNGGVTNHLWQMVEYFDLGPADCVAQTGPVSFDVSVWQLLTPLVIGARVRIIPEPTSLSPAGLLGATLEGGVTLLELVPSAVAALLDAGLARSHGALRVMIATGEALTPDLPRRWRRELPDMPLYNAYGPCECTDDVSIGLSAFGPDADTSTSIGRPLTNTSMYLLDADMVPTPLGVAGALCVGGAGVGRGYLGDPRRTAAAFLPDPWSAVPGARMYHTGDLARTTARGDVEFLGRSDTQIKIRGLRIEAGEVEAALRECADIADAAVKVEHGVAGGFLVGYLVFGESDETRVLTPAEDERVRAALARRLPRHMIPTVLVQVPPLPRSGNGKTDYQALSYVAAAPAPESDPDSFDDPLSAAVRAIWCGLLDRDTVRWNDSFFELGGHSLLALAMIDRVEQRLGVRLGVDSVFTHPRLSGFVELVRLADPATPGRDRVPVDPGVPVPASAAQKRFWFLREIDRGRPTYNMPGVLRMRGALDEDVLGAALREVLARHPVLLARFAEHDGALTWTPGSVEEFTLSRLDLRGPVAEFGDEVFDRVMADEANTVADLRREFPFRALLARLGQKDWGLFVVIDHIVCDGWSLTVFLTDLAHAYNRGVRGDARPLPEIEYGFADYCHDEQAWRVLRDPAQVEALWRGVATGPVSLSSLPTRPVGSSGAGRHTRWIADDSADAIRDLARRTGLTPYMVFATALSTVVHSGSADRETVLLGVLIAQRDRPELRAVVGPLLSVSVLAVELAMGDTGAEALRSARDGALRAYRSAHIPLPELTRLLPPAPGGDGSPFEIMLIMQPADVAAEFDGISTELADVDTDAAPYPLTVDIEERDGGYRVSYRYAADRYDPDDVEAMAERVHAVLRTITTHTDNTLDELRSSTSAERN
ncbi:Non-ribosomal peptide synthase [Alloactinosynnema sp. L-07]|uniref:non-ribosomal peptide synthetase n=1 Tax=Alloactinosynnema sp. L-07 TaxID=1653480 RepID=UPI00065EFB18|nr:non-ribosomal peptide synthetase [Alloactinosynnema sp. L-07]CRK56742.1 Non-ribosomal peptide synthase [Alloactinosynnema sp. L-07]